MAEQALTVGVDLGGTKILTALVDGAGRVVASHRLETPVDDGFEGVAATVVDTVRNVVGDASTDPRALGIGVAGQVSRGGVVRFAPNLEWHDAPLGGLLTERLGLPAVVLNDVRAAAWGEWRHGAGRGVADLVVVFLGTGVGGGVVSGGNLLEGCDNAAGELGHTMLVSGGRPCRCPNDGCLEAYVGGWAIAERAREAIRADGSAGARLVELAGSEEEVTAAHVTEAWREGDVLGARIHEATVAYLASGLVGLANAYNPCRIVLGGGVIESVPELVDAVCGPVLERALGPVAEGLEIVRAERAGEAGVIGAASCARRALDGTMT